MSYIYIYAHIPMQFVLHFNWCATEYHELYMHDSSIINGVICCYQKAWNIHLVKFYMVSPSGISILYNSKWVVRSHEDMYKCILLLNISVFMCQVNQSCQRIAQHSSIPENEPWNYGPTNFHIPVAISECLLLCNHPKSLSSKCNWWFIRTFRSD